MEVRSIDGLEGLIYIILKSKDLYARYEGLTQNLDELFEKIGQKLNSAIDNHHEENLQRIKDRITQIENDYRFYRNLRIENLVFVARNDPSRFLAFQMVADKGFFQTKCKFRYNQQAIERKVHLVNKMNQTRKENPFSFLDRLFKNAQPVISEERAGAVMEFVCDYQSKYFCNF